MATTYKYRFDLEGGFVQFNIAGLQSAALVNGETIAISGQAQWKYNLRGINLSFRGNLQSVEDSVVCDPSISVNIASGKAGNFSAQCDVQASAALLASMTGRSTNIKIECSVNGRNGKADVYESTMVTLSTTLLKYALTPKITASTFERTDASGAAKNDGRSVTCRKLGLSIHPSAKIDDITVATISVTAEGAAAPLKTANITRTQLQTMLSSAAYVESKPALLSGVDFDTGKNYYIDIAIGDAYDLPTFRYAINRAFALIDFARKKKGGVAIGQYSSSTDAQPLFEVAESHKARFYGGIDGVNNYTSGEVATGGHWIDGKPIYRRVISFSGKQTGNNLAMLASFTPDMVGALIHVDMILKSSANGGYYPVPFVFSTTTSSAEGYRLGWSLRDATGLSLHIGTSYSGGYTVTAIIDYTKSAANDPAAPDGPEIFDPQADHTDA